LGHSHWKASGLPLTQDRLKQFVAYDPETGRFDWIVPRAGRKSSYGAGSRPSGRASRLLSIDGVLYTTGRLAWLYVHGEWPIGTIGHRNRDPHDDRIANLEDIGATKRDFRSGSTITAERLRELATYEPDTGIFRWKMRSARTGGGRALPGAAFGKHLRNGYMVVIIDCKRYSYHRLAWLYMTGEWPPHPRVIDHINRDKADNRWSNLRLASRSQNARNRAQRKDSGNPYKGIFQQSDGKWGAQIMLKLGTADTPEEAQALYMAAARWYYGEFASSE
jgi:hypothetical protein